MDLKEMIEKASKIVGTQRILAERIGELENNLGAAKKGRRGITDEACAKLALILEIEYGQVSAARNAAMAKDQNQKDFWLPFVQGIPRQAAAWMIASATAATIGLTAPNEANATDTYKVSSTPAQPAPLSDSTTDGMYIMSIIG